MICLNHKRKSSWGSGKYSNFESYYCSEKRTKVIDDENDYYQLDSKWLTEKQRKVLNKKKEEMDELMNDRKKQTFSFDFAGRKIVEETPDIHFDPEELMKSDTSILDCQNFSLEFPADLHPVVSFILMSY